MRVARLSVVASFALTAAILGWALLSTTAMRGQLQRELGSTIAAFVLGALVCGWPWFKAFSAAGEQKGTLRALSFSAVSVVIAASFAKPISTAPMEGVGWNVIFCVLLMWGAYAVTSWLGEKEPP